MLHGGRDPQGPLGLAIRTPLKGGSFREQAGLETQAILGLQNEEEVRTRAL